MDSQSIMMATDFGSSSTRAMATAITMARALDAPLEIVHVCAPIPIEAQAEGATPPYVQAAAAQLARLKEWAEAAGVEATTQLRGEAIIFGLLQLLDERQPRLIVVGSHGRHGLARALHGSVSESLARRSPVPVLIVPAEPTPLAGLVAWSCQTCGHIFADGERRDVCERCGTTPARWLAAPIGGAGDSVEPAVGEGAAAAVEPSAEVYEPVTPFATAPAGVSGYDVNPELRIRRF